MLVTIRAAALVATSGDAPPMHGDEPRYDRFARGLLAGEGYHNNGQPWVHRPPGWPLLLAGIYGSLGDGRRTVVAFQAACDAATCLIYGWLGAAIAGTPFAGAIAFALALAWPPFFRESAFLQTEPSFTLGIAVITLLAFLLHRRPNTAAALGLGVATGLASLIRPAGVLYLGGLLAGWVWLSRAPVSVRVRSVALVVAGLLVVILPWTIRNLVVARVFVPLSTGMGEQFLQGAWLETRGRWDHDVWERTKARLLAAEIERLGRRPSPVEEDRAYLREGLEIWKRHPGASAWIAVQRLARLCLVPVASGGLVRWGFLAVILALYAVAIPAGLRSFAAAEHERRMLAILLVAVVIYVIGSAAVYTNSRYLEPLRPAFMLMAAAAVAPPRSTRAAPRERGAAQPARSR